MGKSVTFFESSAIETAAVVCSSRTHQNMDALDIVSRILNTEPEMENFLATYKLGNPGTASLFRTKDEISVSVRPREELNFKSWI